MAGDPLEPQPKRSPSAKVFSCTNCGASITLRALGHTVSATCPSCGSLIDVLDENLQILQKYEFKTRLKPLIPLGQRGKLHGDTWEAIGFMQRSDGTGDYLWREYLLFNPYKGFSWLTEADGHWNFVRTTKERPKSAVGNSIVFRDTPYQLFTRGTARVCYVIGEFYWRVGVNDTVAVEDYIHPPHILSCEENDQEINWSHGVYVEPEVIKSAFMVEAPMPARIGIAPNQPSPWGAKVATIRNLAVVFVVLACLLQLGSAIMAPNESVYSQAIRYESSDSQKTRVTPSFELAGGTTNVEIGFDAGVQNSWLSLEGSLVNEQTGAEYEFEQGVEYYYGRDSDGDWTEGSPNSLRVLSSIPGGRYHLNYQLTGQSLPGSLMAKLSIRRGVVIWSNFIWALVLLAVFPLIVWWRGRSFELTRWSTSDYSPYFSVSDD